MLNTIRTACGYSIPPNEIIRIDFDAMKYPKFEAVFDTAKTRDQL